MERGTIKQGDSLSPLLFIFVMDKILESAKERRKPLQTLIRYNQLIPVKIESLLYADDIVSVTDTFNKIKKMIQI